MTETRLNFHKTWEVSIMRLENSAGIKFKVTRKMPTLYIAETRMFTSKEEAKRQFDEWLK
ncbi:MAG TPA: hypothetical protein VJG31_03245 [Candidatus Nanoarchaeia archaeon]|nr:hypothetical protein [Candidatus Nanoarchaeia archaeon]